MNQHIAHHGLIKLIVMDALIHLRNLFLWRDFVDMDRDVFIETQAITLGEITTSSTRVKGGKTKEGTVVEIEEEEANTKEEEGEKQIAKKNKP